MTEAAPFRNTLLPLSHKQRQPGWLRPAAGRETSLRAVRPDGFRPCFASLAGVTRGPADRVATREPAGTTRPGPLRQGPQWRPPRDRTGAGPAPMRFCADPCRHRDRRFAAKGRHGSTPTAVVHRPKAPPPARPRGARVPRHLSTARRPRARAPSTSRRHHPNRCRGGWWHRMPVNSVRRPRTSGEATTVAAGIGQQTGTVVARFDGKQPSPALGRHPLEPSQRKRLPVSARGRKQRQ